jgi:hypothetical protein
MQLKGFDCHFASLARHRLQGGASAVQPLLGDFGEGNRAAALAAKALDFLFQFDQSALGEFLVGGLE